MKEVYVLHTDRKLRPEQVDELHRIAREDLKTKLLIVQEGARLTKLNQEWGATRGGFIKAGAMPDVRLEVL